ncbi:transcriptional antitermination N peptide [Hafnia paralvei]
MLGFSANRQPKEESGGACLPQVAIFAAGHRNTRKEAVHITK